MAVSDSEKKLKIAVLAVQGAFIEHEKMLEQLGAECIELRQAADCEQDFDGLVLPGGESTVQNKLLRELGMYDILKAKIDAGLPVLATCAGMILLADTIGNDDMRCFGTLPVTVRRNAYGRQLGSFSGMHDVAGIGEFEMRFIRAPYVEKINESASASAPADEKAAGSDSVHILGTVENRIVGVEYKNQIALAFHPELTDDTRIHEKFLKLCA
ncbi:MAG: pyridoxal 5'-phosphate synthase glutaminase subunit PdxT [Anaerovoracaceae bacterium]|nr:pyridoxal 5'-phosphate synthase glutaminase subunit PdxT [Bacillota bacterium]MDD7734791.1 pyridoxal 5'-phosphate synthase glutaminase subunit PdxT [Bacillota bacterium]MDY5906001.1 pyridoxal 5'-phosphate synthase glutaminase subunit PdxT [Anaerovoracaceae bacterium]